MRELVYRDYIEVAERLGEALSFELEGFCWLCSKGPLEDIVPGLSDLDLRVVVEGADVERWLRAGDICSDVYVGLVREHPEWARILEQPPGAMVGFEELADPSLFLPEARCWDLLAGEVDSWEEFRREMACKEWTERDAAYNLGKFRSLLVPYSQVDDPPINLSELYISKYPLHSRIKHLFLPALRAGLSLVLRRPVRSKREALREGLNLFGDLLLKEVAEILERNYEVDMDREALASFDDRCLSFLRRLGEEMSVPEPKPDPLFALYIAVIAARGRRGIFRFYLRVPEHFSTDWLVENEMKHIRELMAGPSLRAYTEVKLGRKVSPEEVPEALKELLGTEALETAERVRAISEGRLGADNKERLEMLASVWRDYYAILDELLKDARRRV